MIQRSQRLLLPLLAGALLLSVACSRGPSPSVRDMDSYETVELGSFRYTAPRGIRVIEKGPGFVEHEVTDMPNTTVRIQVDPNPPRDFAFDADAERRRFLDEMGSRNTRSAQYHEVVNQVGDVTQRRVKVHTSTTNKEGVRLYGALMVIRQDNKTATIRSIGPFSERQGIDRIVERMANLVQFD